MTFIKKKIFIETIGIYAPDESLLEKVGWILNNAKNIGTKGYVNINEISSAVSRTKITINLDLHSGKDEDIQIILNEIHQCSVTIDSVVCIDYTSHIGGYSLIKSQNTANNMAYAIFEGFIEGVKDNLDESLNSVGVMLGM